MTKGRCDRGDSGRQRPARIFAIYAAVGLVLNLVAAIDGSAQEGGGETWLRGLEGKAGHVTGTLEPRFDLASPGDADDSGPDPGDPDGATGAGAAPGSGAEVAASAGPATSGEPTPDDPVVASLIMQWIGLAEPPENSRPGYDLRYTEWAQLVGRAATGTITANAKPDNAAGYADPPSYLWALHQGLPSLNLCTLGEFVRIALARGDLSHCRIGEGQVASTPTAGASGSQPTAAQGETARGTAPRSPDTQSSDQGTATGRDGGPPRTSDPTEIAEDDGASGPQSIGGTSIITGHIQPRADRDEYVFEAPHHGEWSFFIDAAPTGVEIKLGVYPAPNGNWLPGMKSEPAAALVVDLKEPGAYILRINGAKADMSSEAPYRVRSLFRPSPDLFEPNQKVAEATPIEGTRQIVGTILPRGERDEFIFEAPHHGEWTVDVTGEPEGVDVAVGVFPHPNGNWLPNMTDAENRLVVDLPKPGKYVLRANGAKPDMRSVSPYKLNLSFVASPDLFEPNQKLAEATPIEGTRQILGTILPRGERDEFIFEAPHHGEWTMDVTGEPEGVDVAVGVFPHPNGNWLPNMTDAENRLVVDLPKPGKYVLRANGAKPDMRSVDPYRLNLSFAASPDLFEPNQKVAEATQIEGTRRILGTILPRGERDEFIFEAPHHGEWTVDVTGQPEGVDVAVGVFPHPNGNWLPNMTDAENRLVVDLSKPGKYVLRANGAKPDMRSVAPYTLNLSFAASPDLFEPNQKVAEATPIEGTRQVVGTILPRGERDEFIFEAPHHGEWTVDVTGEPDGVDVAVGVFPHPNGNWLANMTDAENRLVVDLPKPGKYVLRANGAKPDMRSVAPYTLDLSFAASPDQHEPNQNVDEAEPITIGGSIIGTILPRGERDQFIFSAAGPGLIVIDTVQSPAGVEIATGVFPAPNGNWLRDRAPDDPRRLVVELPSAGDYVLRVNAAKPDMRSVEPYRLSTSRQ